MKTEIEAKFLNIDIKRLREKLKSLKAKLIHPKMLMLRKNFDYLNRKEIAGWIRVRKEYGKITLSYKILNDRTLHGTKEITVEVDDFEKTCQFLTAIGLTQTSYQETKREKWLFGNCEITIDTWPWIPTFVEIEADDEELLKNVANKLGFNWSDAMHGSVETVYQKYYNVTNQEIHYCPSITFTKVPKWLDTKKKIRKFRKFDF